MQFRWNVTFRTEQSRLDRDYTFQLERSVVSLEEEIRRLKIAAAEMEPQKPA